VYSCSLQFTHANLTINTQSSVSYYSCFQQPPRIRRIYSKDLIKTIGMLMNKMPSARPSIDELLALVRSANALVCDVHLCSLLCCSVGSARVVRLLLWRSFVSFFALCARPIATHLTIKSATPHTASIMIIKMISRSNMQLYTLLQPAVRRRMSLLDDEHVAIEAASEFVSLPLFLYFLLFPANDERIRSYAYTRMRTHTQVSSSHLPSFYCFQKLLNTIALPSNLHELQRALPSSCYEANAKIVSPSVARTKPRAVLRRRQQPSTNNNSGNNNGNNNAAAAKAPEPHFYEPYGGGGGSGGKENVPRRRRNRQLNQAGERGNGNDNGNSNNDSGASSSSDSSEGHQHMPTRAQPRPAPSVARYYAHHVPQRMPQSHLHYGNGNGKGNGNGGGGNAGAAVWSAAPAAAKKAKPAYDWLSPHFPAAAAENVTPPQAQKQGRRAGGNRGGGGGGGARAKPYKAAVNLFPYGGGGGGGGRGRPRDTRPW
jgi:hypothetical protein